jgi:hypothetical protein
MPQPESVEQHRIIQSAADVSSLSFHLLLVLVLVRQSDRCLLLDCTPQLLLRLLLLVLGLLLQLLLLLVLLTGCPLDLPCDRLLPKR